MTVEDIIIEKGRSDLLLICPHGHHKDDENTAELAQAAAGHLGCQAIVNRAYRKPRGSQWPNPAAMRLDLNKSDQARLHPNFIDAIRAVADAPGRTLVIWIHGIRDENIFAEAQRTAEYHGAPEALLVLAGYGQGKSPKTGEPHHRYTVAPETGEGMVGLLTASGLTANAVRANAANYRGRHEDYMNQWFVQNDYPLSAVESIQLEFKYTGVRDAGSLDSAAESLATALGALQSR